MGNILDVSNRHRFTEYRHRRAREQFYRISSLRIATTKICAPIPHDINVRFVKCLTVSTEKGETEEFKFGKFYKNEVLKTLISRYQIEDCLGMGSFSQVLLGWSIFTGEHVAIKVMRKRKGIAEEVTKEIKLLRKLTELERSQFYFVQLHYAFICKDQYCLVFEALEQSLQTYIRLQRPKLLQLLEIKIILKQICMALIHLKKLGIIHADLKSSNIMFVDSINAPYHIKLIDFGDAISTYRKVQTYQKLQTLAYRSPEIILGLPFDNGVDVWSAGCVAAEMYLGCTLYNGCTEYDQLQLISETQGQPAQELLTKAKYTKRFFNKNDSSLWVFKNSKKYESETGKKCGNNCQYRFSNLDELLYFSKSITDVDYEKFLFVDLLKQMLILNNDSRITAIDTLQHDFLRSSNGEFI